MPFVHGLVMTEIAGKPGWCAPVELGEAAPHYVSFVLPVDDHRDFFDCYSCETITAKDGRKRLKSHELVKRGNDSFVLRIDNLEVWFNVRPGPKKKRCFHYVGKLRHPDFGSLFMEIEPADLDRLDRLFEEDGTFVIGCEPFTHYSGIKSQSKKVSAPRSQK